MAERADTRPAILSVPIGHDLCDATAALLLRHCNDDLLEISRATLLLPNNRAIKSMTEAFVRLAKPGLLLPRLAAVGDLDLDESLGPLIDPLDDEEPLLPAIAPAQRTMLLTELVTKHRNIAGQVISPAEAMRLARELAAMIDELEIEEIDLAAIGKDEASEGDLAKHWQRSYEQLMQILPDYQAQLVERQLLGPSDRRNKLLHRLRDRLRSHPPQGFVVAAGITTAAKAVAGVLRQVASMQNGLVILPGVDLEMPEDQWSALGPHAEPEDGTRAPRNHESHPQFHLKLLLERMGVARGEVEQAFAPDPIGKSVADIFCLPFATTKWSDLPPAAKKMPHVLVLQMADGAEEARAISICVREALEQPEQRIAVITPDRELAVRVAAQLRRWNISVDDSAGTPLVQTANGTLIMALANAYAQRFAPVALLAIAKHPLVHAKDERLAWLDNVRRLDLVLRGPAKGLRLKAIGARIDALDPKNHADKADLAEWWLGLQAVLQPIENLKGGSFADVMESIATAAQILTNGVIWRGATGRQLAQCWEEFSGCNLTALDRADRSAIPAVLNEMFSRVVVRPPYGGHPRVAIYGLLEARLQQADILICGGLNEGTWPQLPQPDPWLSPALRRQLHLATLDRNIGLSAHDLSIALGAKRVLLTRAQRDRGGPTVASRFLLRIEAYLGAALLADDRLLQLARKIDQPDAYMPAQPPVMRPNAAQRDVTLRITDFDRLKADPFSFYANKIMGLRPLDSVEAAPDHAWRGSAIHDILEQWAKADKLDPEKLIERANRLLSDEALHPALRALWQPRISAALRWVADEAASQASAHGRIMKQAEISGEFVLAGSRVKGRVDRIDRLADGSLAIVDYKKGTPPSNAQVAAGFALQLGLLGLMAEADGFDEIKGQAKLFEYWSLAKKQGRSNFGYIQNPVTGKKDAPATPEEFMAAAKRVSSEAIEKWIKGTEAFTAKLHPKYATYADYDQLMRLQEWDGRQLPDDGDGI